MHFLISISWLKFDRWKQNGRFVLSLEQGEKMDVPRGAVRVIEATTSLCQAVISLLLLGAGFSIYPEDKKRELFLFLLMFIWPESYHSCSWFTVWNPLYISSLSIETLCDHNVQQAHSGADGLPDRVSNNAFIVLLENIVKSWKSMSLNHVGVPKM